MGQLHRIAKATLRPVTTAKCYRMHQSYGQMPILLLLLLHEMQAQADQVPDRQGPATLHYWVTAGQVGSTHFSKCHHKR
jgi:hypothetical protein